MAFLFISEEVSLCQFDTMATLGLCTLRLCEYCSPPPDLEFLLYKNITYCRGECKPTDLPPVFHITGVAHE